MNTPKLTLLEDCVGALYSSKTDRYDAARRVIAAFGENHPASLAAAKVLAAADIEERTAAMKETLILLGWTP